MPPTHSFGSKSHDDPIPRQYGLCLVGLDRGICDMICNLAPEAHILTFPPPGPSPNEIDVACTEFKQMLMSYCNEPKNNVKRFVIATCGLGEILVKQALVTAARTPNCQEVAVIISHLVFFPSPGQSHPNSSWGNSFMRDVTRAPISRQLLAHIESMSTNFNSIDRNYYITNIISSVMVPDAYLSPQATVESSNMVIELERSPDTAAISDNINNLIQLYNCLFPTPDLGNESFFKVSDYFDCLERLTWSWRPIVEDQKSEGVVPMEIEVKKQLIRHLGLHERESRDYPTTACLFGPLGCGKTSFLRNFPRGLEAYKDIITVQFEKQDFQRANPSVSDVLKSLSHQVLCHVPSTFSRIKHFYQFLSGYDIWSEQLLWSLVRRLLEGFQYKLVLLIDDIDNWLPEFKTIFEKLGSFRKSSPLVLRFIYTVTGNGRYLIPGPILNINLAEEATRREIAHNLMEGVLVSQLKSQYISEAIDFEMQKISESCLTSYLYAKQVSRLPNASSVLHEVLPGLPRNRDKVYLAELESPAGENRHVLQWRWRCLSWLVQAARPMTVSELSVAVALDQMSPDITRSGIENRVSVTTWEDLDRHLGLFVYREGSRLAILHTTAKDFIHSHSANISQEYRISSHAAITTLCLEYLEIFIAACDEAEAQDHLEYAFIPYSVEYWPRHYQLVGDGNLVDDPNLDRRVLQFFSKRDIWVPWLKRFQVTASRLISVESTEVHVLIVVCGLGQAKLVSHILHEERHLISEDVLQRSLDTAIRNDQLAIIRILLEAGVRSKLSLPIAAERNMVDVMKLLMHEDTFKEPKSLERAITTAAIHGSLEAITELCDHCTDPETLAQIQLSAVDDAAAGGHVPLLSFLLAQLYGYNNDRSSKNSGHAAVRISEGNTESDNSPIQCVSALENAAKLGYNEIVRLLLDAGTKATGLALEIASKRRNIALVRLLTKHLIVEHWTDAYTNALHFAAERGDIHVVEELLHRGVYPDSRDGTNRAPLHAAAKQGHTAVVQLLLDRGAKADAEDDQGVMPCHLAALNGHIQTYKALQKEPEMRQDDLLVTYAAKGGHLLMVKYLLSLKLAGDNTGGNTRPALLKAASYGHLSIVRELHKAGSSLNSRTGTESPLHTAASRGYADVVSFLINNGANVNPIDEARRTPLHLGMANPKVVEMLLEKGADPNTTDIEEKSPLHIAAAGTSAEAEVCVGILISKESKINVRDDYGKTPIHYAAASGCVGSVTALLENGADITVTNNQGQTPLGSAVEGNRIEVVKLLFSKGANINHGSGITPLIQASQGGFTDIVGFLLENGADYNITNGAGWPPLCVAAGYGRSEATQVLLNAGADVHQSGGNGSTALHWASQNGFIDVMRMLLGHGAHPNAQNNTGMTPLHRAASKGHAQGVQVLLEHGVNISIQNHDNKTALQIARGDAVGVLQRANDGGNM